LISVKLQKFCYLNISGLGDIQFYDKKCKHRRSNQCL
jgi:hypothetical protein